MASTRLSCQVYDRCSVRHVYCNAAMQMSSCAAGKCNTQQGVCQEREGTRLELAPQAVHDDVQVELAHAFNDGLVGLLIAGEVEGGVLLGQLDEPVAHLLQVALALRLDRDLDDRVCAHAKHQLSTPSLCMHLSIFQSCTGHGV